MATKDERAVARVERGWVGHFICGNSCRFRRNTLLSVGKKKIIVSTVGNYHCNEKLDTIGAFGRYYETMAFEAKREGKYWEIDTGKQLSFESEWAISADHPNKLPDDVDNQADRMHEKVVAELSARLASTRASKGRSK